MVSAKVSATRKKNGGTANDPGVVICANVADPSRMVLMMARTKISHPTRRCRSLANMRNQLVPHRPDTLHHGGREGHGGTILPCTDLFLRVHRVLCGGALSFKSISK